MKVLVNVAFTYIVNPDEVVYNYRYVEKKPGQFVADTSCEKLPKELCGKGELANKLLLKVTTACVWPLSLSLTILCSMHLPTWVDARNKE